MIEHASRDQALLWHLQSNHYPPVHSRFVETAKLAIKAANAGKWNRKIKMVNGLTRTAAEIIEGLHLEDFLNQEPPEDTNEADEEPATAPATTPLTTSTHRCPNCRATGFPRPVKMCMFGKHTLEDTDS